MPIQEKCTNVFFLSDIEKTQRVHKAISIQYMLIVSLKMFLFQIIIFTVIVNNKVVKLVLTSLRSHDDELLLNKNLKLWLKNCYHPSVTQSAEN